MHFWDVQSLNRNSLNLQNPHKQAERRTESPLILTWNISTYKGDNFEWQSSIKYNTVAGGNYKYFSITFPVKSDISKSSV